MDSNDLALWHLRLNGFLAVPNFILHPYRRGPQDTDADLVAVRFPHRAEFDDDPNADDPRFARRSVKPYFVVAESTRGTCKINGPWMSADSFAHVLRAFGPIDPRKIQTAAAQWAVEGGYADDTFDCGLLCFGECENPELHSKPRVEQVVWSEVLRFLYGRFSEYSRRKRDHQQWGHVGNELWNLWENSRNDEPSFSKRVRAQFNLAA